MQGRNAAARDGQLSLARALQLALAPVRSLSFFTSLSPLAVRDDLLGSTLTFVRFAFRSLKPPLSSLPLPQSLAPARLPPGRTLYAQITHVPHALRLYSLTQWVSLSGTSGPAS